MVRRIDGKQDVDGSGRQVLSHFETAQTVAAGGLLQSHPAAPSQWRTDYVMSDVDVDEFRGHSAYVRQGAPADQYLTTWEYVTKHDRFNLLSFFDEDESFGPQGIFVGDRFVTRDLLDSVLEISFLLDELKVDRAAPVSILDIGAGYGRFAHRCKSALPRARFTLCDAVPLSSALAKFYLDFRQVKDCEFASLDQVEGLRPGSFDLAVTMHAFNEMPHSAVSWWLGQLARLEVPWLYFVPNNCQGFLSYEPDGGRESFQRALVKHGYTLKVARDKYCDDWRAQRDALYPDQHMLFVRTDIASDRVQPRLVGSPAPCE